MEYQKCIKEGREWVPKGRPPSPQGTSLADLVAAQDAEDEAKQVRWGG